MRTNANGFRWDTRRERAAVLVAEDELTDRAIATEIGVHVGTLERWKLHPTFMAKVSQHVQQLEAETLKFAIAKRRNRVRALDRRWAAMLQVIDERAVEMSATDDDGNPLIPGGATGLLVRQTKSIGFGPNNTVVDEYAVDTGLLKELREHEKQAAEELGQWISKSEMTGPHGTPLEHRIHVIEAFVRDPGAAELHDELLARLDAVASGASVDPEPGRVDPREAPAPAEPKAP